jgi:hypothetical protein
MRVKAIWNAFKHGILPWWCYESHKHYKGNYWAHLWLNIKYAWRWATFREFESDIDFENKTNKVMKKKKKKEAELTFTRDELVRFGYYLLSPARRELYSKSPQEGFSVEDRLSQVNHADVENFINLITNGVPIDGWMGPEATTVK